MENHILGKRVKTKKTDGRMEKGIANADSLIMPSRSMVGIIWIITFWTMLIQNKKQMLMKDITLKSINPTTQIMVII